MTVLGLLLIIVGAFVGLTGSIPYNGQWLLGFLIAIVGWALCAYHTYITKEK
ncbi:membrane protein [Microbacterium phage TinyMiny]|nr:membrane protein [Microbacterium phage TinyMiny]